MVHSLKSQQFLTESRLRDAMTGDLDACFELGVSFSTGADGCPLDLIAAHKWFNIAALGGNGRAMECRAEIAGDMTRREIVEAQRQARAMLGLGQRLAA
jgi:TPR repeat protein